MTSAANDIFRPPGVVPIVNDRKTDMRTPVTSVPPVGGQRVPINPVRRAKITPNIRAFAAQIAGDHNIPSWLAQGLANAIASVRFALSEEAKNPNRTVIRSQLTKLGEMASAILHDIESPTIFKALSHHDGNDLSSIRAARDGAIALSNLVSHAIEEIPSGSGRYNIADKYNINSKLMCALFVSCVFLEIEGRVIKHTAEKYQRACSTLWLLSGGEVQPSSSGDPDTPKRWRDTLREAKREGLSGILCEGSN